MWRRYVRRLMMKLRLPELMWIGDRWSMVAHTREQRLFVHGWGGDNLSWGHLLHGSYGFLLLLRVKVGLVVTRHLELGLHLPQLPPGQHLDVAAHLLPGPGLASPQLDISGNQFISTIHLALVRQDDFSSATRRVDGKSLLEALFNLWCPDTLSILSSCLLVIIKLTRVKFSNLRADCLRNSCQPYSIIALETQLLKHWQW